MGLSDTVQQLIVVKADTSDARAEVRKLRGEEKRAAQERLSELEATNKGIDDHIAKWAKVAVGVGAAVGAFKLAQAAARNYLEDVRLQAAAGSANLERLQKATNGLVEADNLLAFAGKAQAGVWKLNQQEMETVLHGALALRKTMGVELQPTVEKLTEAITKGSTRALKEFGIEAKDKQGTLRELQARFNGLGGDASMAGDDMSRAGVKLTDALDDISGALGRLVVALTPAVEALADFATSVADAMGGTLSVIANDPKVKQQIELAKELNRLAAEEQSALEIPEATLFAEWEKQKAISTKLFAMIMAGRNPFAVAGGSRGGAVDDGRGGGITGYSPGSALTYGAGGSTSLGATQGATIPGIGGDLGGAGGIDSDRIAALIEQLKPLKAAVAEIEGPTVLERIFGDASQISATTVAIETAQRAVEMFGQAGAAAMGAWIDGSKSMSEAVKNVLANSLKSVAMEATAKSLFHLAAAAGSFAFLSPAQAMLHLKAAGMYGSVALVAGAGAKVAHNAGWAGGASMGGAPAGTSAGGYLGSSGGGGTQTSNTVIYVTGDAYRMSQAQREHMIADAARRGQQKRSSNVVAHR